MMKYKAILNIVLLTLVLCLFPKQIFAQPAIDMDAVAGLTIVFRDGETVMRDASFDVYRIGDVHDDGNISLNETYAHYPINLQPEDSQAWRGTATALKGYILQDNLKPDFPGKIDAQGELNFNQLSCGVYFVVGDRYEYEGNAYESEPVFAILPARDQAGDSWSYHLTVEPKTEIIPLPESPEEEYTMRKVLKVWEDDEADDNRPKTVTVDLLRNGAVYDTVKLSEDCHWSHTWNRLEKKYSWTIVERPVEAYTVTVDRENKTFVLTNTFEENSETKEPDPEPKPEPEHGNDEDTLPLTGQPWIVCILLFAVGLLFVVVGLLCKRGEQDGC